MDARTNAVAWQPDEDDVADARIIAFAPSADPMVEFDALLRHLRLLAQTLRDDPRVAEASLASLPARRGHAPVADPGPGSGPGPGEPSPVDREVLLLLAAGATDESIARHLGISGRTVQRRVRALMDSLGVQTRFQAGVQAALRHWC